MTEWAFLQTRSGIGVFSGMNQSNQKTASRYHLLENGGVEWADGCPFTSGASPASGGVHGSYRIKTNDNPGEPRSASIVIPLNMSSKSIRLV